MVEMNFQMGIELIAENRLIELGPQRQKIWVKK
jgi:hypothetical protein